MECLYTAVELHVSLFYTYTYTRWLCLLLLMLHCWRRGPMWRGRAALAAFWFLLQPWQVAAGASPNVLYLISDDLRPELGAWGQGLMKTPNVDRLAAEGTIFLNTFCQQAVCGPSRASFMSGRRPHHTRVFGNGQDFRVAGRDASGAPGSTWTTLPEHFTRQNYTTLGGGKTFHPTFPPNWDEPRSWSQDMAYYPFAYWIQPNTSSVYSGGTCPLGPNASEVCAPCPGPGKPTPTNFSVFASDTWCHLDEPDDNFYDHRLATNTIARLSYAAGLFRTQRRPFFIMSGFVSAGSSAQCFRTASLTRCRPAGPPTHAPAHASKILGPIRPRDAATGHTQAAAGDDAWHCLLSVRFLQCIRWIR